MHMQQRHNNLEGPDMTFFSTQTACTADSHGVLHALYLMNFLLGAFLLFLYTI